MSPYESSCASLSRCLSLIIGAAMTLLFAPYGWAQAAAEPTDFAKAAEFIVAPTRFAWWSASSPDESWIATCYGIYQADVGRVRVWDARTGKVIWEAGETRGIRRVAVSPDGSLVASGNWGGVIHFRDAATGEVKKTINSPGSIEYLAFSADGKRLISCGSSRKLQVWDVATGQALQSFTGHSAVPYGFQFSPDEKLLLSYGRDRSARLWNVEDTKELRLLMHPQQVNSAVFLQDGKQIATVSDDRQLRVFNAASGELVTTLPPFPPEQRITVLAASRDGKLLAAGGSGRIQIWKTGTWEGAGILEGQLSQVFGLAFSRDGQTLMSSDVAGAVRLWDVPARREKLAFELPKEIQAGAGELRGLAVAPDGKLLATASGESQVELRDVDTGDVVRKLVADSVVAAVAFSPKGEALATAGSELCLWTVARGQRTATLRGHTADITSVAWSPDGKLLATGSADKTVRLWNVATQRELAQLSGHTADVLSVAFTPDGRRLVSGSSDATARVWDVEQRKLVKTLTGHAGAIRAIAVSPDGTIATGGDDNLVRLWDAASLNLQRTLKGHQKPVTSLAFSPQGKTLASSGQGGGILIWDLDRGIARRTLNGHQATVTGLAFLPGASALISGSPDQTIRLWKATGQSPQ